MITSILRAEWVKTMQLDFSVQQISDIPAYNFCNRNRSHAMPRNYVLRDIQSYTLSITCILF